MEWNYLKTTSYEWIFILFVCCFVLLTFVKMNFLFQLKDFLRLPFNNKYILIFSKKENLRLPFLFLFLLIQFISLGIFTFFIFENYHFEIENIGFVKDFLPFFIILAISGYCLLKFLFQKLIFYVFDTKNLGNLYLFNKISYSNYAGFLLLFFNIFCLYIFEKHSKIVLISGIFFLYILVFGLLSFTKMYEKIIKEHFLYFILYLCTLEIAPAIIFYQLLTKTQ